jgi:hypothetical protein
MEWLNYIFAGLSLVCLFGLAYSWVWWVKTGRREPGKRTGRAVTALLYNTFLPVLLLSIIPMCFVPRSYAVIGLPFTAVGFLLALRSQGKLQGLLTAYVLLCYLLFAAMIPTLPHGPMPGQSSQHTC